MTGLTFGNIRGLLARRSPHRVSEAGLAEAAVALVVVPNDDESVDTLLIKRAERAGDVWSGHMALPGGRRSPDDRDLLATAVRETREETGIDLDPSTLLGELDDVHPRSPVLPPIVVRPFVFGLAAVPHIVQSREISAFVWTPLAALWGQQIAADVAVRGAIRSVQGYRVGEELVWGMTERILTSFLDILEGGQGLRG